MRILIAAALGFGLAGCTASQHALSNNNHVAHIPVTVSEIQHAIACEFFYAFQELDGDGRETLENWGAFVELKLAAKDSVKITPGIGPMTLKAGNAELTAATAGLTFDDWVEDKNTITYSAPFTRLIERSDCPAAGSDIASSGLGLAEFLVGTGEVINSGGEIGVSGSLPFIALGADGAPIRLAASASPKAAPTIVYNRAFSITRKVGGGLTFKIDHFTFSLGEGNGGGRERLASSDFNKITVTMGRLPPKTRDDVSPARELENSILLQRQDELNQLKDLTPNQVIVVNPPVVP